MRQSLIAERRRSGAGGTSGTPEASPTPPHHRPADVRRSHVQRQDPNGLSRRDRWPPRFPLVRGAIRHLAAAPEGTGRNCANVSHPQTEVTRSFGGMSLCRRSERLNRSPAEFVWHKGASCLPATGQQSIRRGPEIKSRMVTSGPHCLRRDQASDVKSARSNRSALVSTALTSGSTHSGLRLRCSRNSASRAIGARSRMQELKQVLTALLRRSMSGMICNPFARRMHCKSNAGKSVACV
jgi:hypothetical protein